MAYPFFLISRHPIVLSSRNWMIHTQIVSNSMQQRVVGLQMDLIPQRRDHIANGHSDQSDQQKRKKNLAFKQRHFEFFNR